MLLIHSFVPAAGSGEAAAPAVHKHAWTISAKPAVVPAEEGRTDQRSHSHENLVINQRMLGNEASRHLLLLLASSSGRPDRIPFQKTTHLCAPVPSQCLPALLRPYNGISISKPSPLHILSTSKAALH